MTDPNRPKTPCPKDAIQTLIRTTHCIEREFDTRLAALKLPMQLSGPRLRLLLVVEEAGRLRMSELAARLGVKARTVTDLVDALEQDDLLVRRPDPTDRRATLLELTETAQTHIQKAQAAMTEVTERMVGHLTPEQLNELMTLLGLLVDNREVAFLPCKFGSE
ncbi:MarR family transcriptional regulator [Paenibacillus sp. J31TS4]|uniref:MarR family winged helix-turn-helix transcriptional regulator n=1 Tax=Paenibacillus sp. J31TS4 TaxID=2807195 RepID=UPI001B230483|nr:MarR family transcriptional regulator [Paenibacillus sp. J31TS4]GIP39377.1 MarR family transcriptional regulator [Paenibacillus sp. J31TS4]